MNVSKYFKEWGMEFTEEEKIKRIKDRISVLIDEDEFLDEDFYKEINLELGYVRINSISLNVMQTVALAFSPYLSNKGHFIKSLRESDPNEFYYSLSTLISNITNEDFKNDIINLTNKCLIDFDCNNIVLLKDEGDIMIVPSGIITFDEKIIPNNMNWLCVYNKESFDKMKLAIKKYYDGEFRDSCDNARLSLEILFKKVFNKNDQVSLEKTLKEDMGRLLKEKGSTKEFRELFINFNTFINFINKDFKHGDKVGEIETEYVLYYISLIMRVIYKFTSC